MQPTTNTREVAPIIARPPHENKEELFVQLNKMRTSKKEPKNPEAYNAAFEWLRSHNPLEVIDGMPDGDMHEEIYREFSSVYFDHTDPKDHPGFYSPMNWALRAAFVYGYLLGCEASAAE